MSEQQAEPISGETGSSGPANPQAADSSASGASSDLPITSLEPSIRTEAPDLVPDQEASEAPEAKALEVRAHTSEVQASEVRAAEVHVDKPNSPFTPGKLMIMSPDDRGWANENIAPEVETKPNAGNGSAKRRFAAMAAVAVLATVAGAIGGAVATASFGHSSAAAASTSVASDPALSATVARIDSDLVALKASVEHTSKVDVSQFNKTGDRLDRLEKAQAEPAAKLAKLSEAVEKLHAVGPVAAAPQPVPKEVTGSVAPPATTTAAAAAAPKPNVQTADAKNDFGRLPTLDDWVLRDVANGGALIEGRRGMFEVYAGDPVPGLGRVDAIRRQDGRWVVVTSRGLIVSR